MTSADVEGVLRALGVRADDLNAAAGRVGDGEMTTIRALGGEVLAWVWETVTHPFIAAWRLLTSPAARTETKAWIRQVARKEVTQTRHMVSVARALARGEEVPRTDVVAAVHQFVDLLKTALILGMATHHLGPALIRDPLHVLGILASPADEMVGLLLDRPLRFVTRALFGHGHGLLPSSFYDNKM